MRVKHLMSVGNELHEVDRTQSPKKYIGVKDIFTG